MTYFHDFTAPIREIFFGNLLLLICSVLYLIWWVVSFRPNSSGGPAGVFCITAAFLTGIAAVLLMSAGIYSLSEDSKGLPVRFILIGGFILYLLLLLVTDRVFHRTVTSELIIMQIWAVLELSAVTVLYGTGRFGSGCAAILAAIVGIAAVAGLICYVLYYRLDGMASYRDGMVPLITDAFAMVIFLGALLRYLIQ